jgi:hypothetical protein
LISKGSRSISQEDDYWQIKYLTNTNAYVINPNRIHHVLEILKPTLDVPIDIMLADSMTDGLLNVYMSTQEWCRTDIENPNKYMKPIPWYGLYIWMGEAANHPYLPKSHMVWQMMAQEDCQH